MKVAYVITQSDIIGGASIHLLDLAAGVRSQGIDVIVMSGGNGPLATRLANRGIPYIPLQHMKRDIAPVSDYLAFRELRRHLKDLQPDIVHLHSSKAGVIGRLAGRSLAIPTVFTAHGWAFTEGVSPRKRTLYRYIERTMCRFSDRIIAVSDYDRNLALTSRVGSGSLITTIHNGIPSVPVVPKTHNAEDNPTLIMVARFDAPKDHESVIRAVAQIKELKWTLHLVGDGPTRQRSIGLTKELGIQDRVLFPGECNDIPERLAQADIMILMSNWEGLPLSILEAMRAGLPVIATNVGGVPETINDGRTGLLVSRGNVDQLRDAIVKLLADPIQRRKMGRKAHQHFQKCFNFEIMLEATTAIYKELGQRP